MNKIVAILMERDDIAQSDAEIFLEEARDAVNDGEDPTQVLLEHFGLEPDYIFDLIGG